MEIGLDLLDLVLLLMGFEYKKNKKRMAHENKTIEVECVGAF